MLNHKICSRANTRAAGSTATAGVRHVGAEHLASDSRTLGWAQKNRLLYSEVSKQAGEKRMENKCLKTYAFCY